MPMNRENSYKVEVVDLTSSGTIAPAGTETITLQPNAGYSYEVIELGFYAQAPAGGAAGTHKITGGYQNGRNVMFTCTALFGSAVQIKQEGFQGNSGEAPSTIPEQIMIMRKTIHATNAQPYDFVYTNDTDVNQATDRSLILIVKKYREAI